MSAAAPSSTPADDPTAMRVHAAVGGLTVLINLAYLVVGYYGFAPPPGGMPTDWWHGRTFILDWESMGGYVDAPSEPLHGAGLNALGQRRRTHSTRTHTHTHSRGPRTTARRTP